MSESAQPLARIEGVQLEANSNTSTPRATIQTRSLLLPQPNGHPPTPSDMEYESEDVEHMLRRKTRAERVAEQAEVKTEPEIEEWEQLALARLIQEWDDFEDAHPLRNPIDFGLFIALWENARAVQREKGRAGEEEARQLETYAVFMLWDEINDWEDDMEHDWEDGMRVKYPTSCPFDISWFILEWQQARSC
ncbi:hypothetical protein BGX29_009105 [Mortierella sp. GBA35]|nr:hypothetical protein BGX29_009105 [Mortierella sp. GBA35]